ncbi:hypothetical protein QE152_g39978 [Popillia japonica]|uniref:DUF4352 domain-containing protein n=1 Tax=Popillia japonica TaxID=7064 RepID=A0AAW1HSF6_POPJA
MSMGNVRSAPIEENECQIGEQFDLGKWSITLDSYQLDSAIHISDPELEYDFDAEEGKCFLELQLTVTNNDNTERLFIDEYSGRSPVIELFYDDEYAYKYESNGITSTKKFQYLNWSPLATESGSMTFYLPLQILDSENSIVLKMKQGNSIASIKLR